MSGGKLFIAIYSIKSVNLIFYISF